VWFSEEAIAGWRAAPRTTRGGQPLYSDLAISTALTLRAVFRLALRQSGARIEQVIAVGWGRFGAKPASVSGDRPCRSRPTLTGVTGSRGSGTG
jgi:hypothetical protein